FVELMREAGVAKRMDAESFIHDGTVIAYDNEEFRIDFTAHTGTPIVIYGQTELTRDLYDAREADGAKLIFNTEDVAIHDADTDAPYVTYTVGGQSQRIDCDYVAGCDGFHGISRQTIPDTVRRDYEKLYPFGWLGVLSETPPVHDELVYSNSDRGFALCSMRNTNLSRHYIQCPLSDSPEDWSDAKFWN
ncbi:4-hydroxybenzoate 3-monooxygenase, partial [Escherichia coli]|nr:4-hydroxybenzoate 3-monooxygenase [Escherichia coli]